MIDFENPPEGKDMSDNKKMNPKNIDEVKLTDEGLENVVGGSSGEFIPVCCKPELGGCRHIEMIRHNATNWTCKKCGLPWSVDQTRC